MESMARQDQNFGKDYGLIHEAIVTGRKVGAGHGFWSKIAHDEDLFRRVVEFVDARSALSVVVNYDLSLNGMIKAGKYDWVNQDITAEHFPIKGEGESKLNLEFFHFNRIMESDEVFAEMDEAGYRPATIEELLALGAQYPEEQRKYFIVALGSVWQRPHGYRVVPCLWSDVRERNLNLNWLDNRWNANYRFAAVRNSLHSSSSTARFYFGSCFIHPPSIFPISSIFSDRSMYFLLSKALTSQDI